MKFFTKETLMETVREGNERGYNRQLNPDILDEGLAEDQLFPVSFTLPHEHIAGEQVEPHLRVMVVINADGDQATLDMSTERYAGLPDSQRLPQTGLTDAAEGSRRTGGQGGKGGLSIVR